MEAIALLIQALLKEMVTFTPDEKKALAHIRRTTNVLSRDRKQKKE
ncbi:MAG: hypothetical protein LUF01_13395 [Bacteroides sp.]|nr:hypothetical protein [Bacteroides sp.]